MRGGADAPPLSLAGIRSINHAASSLYHPVDFRDPWRWHRHVLLGVSCAKLATPTGLGNGVRVRSEEPLRRGTWGSVAGHAGAPVGLGCILKRYEMVGVGQPLGPHRLCPARFKARLATGRLAEDALEDRGDSRIGSYVMVSVHNALVSGARRWQVARRQTRPMAARPRLPPQGTAYTDPSLSSVSSLETSRRRPQPSCSPPRQHA